MVQGVAVEAESVKLAVLGAARAAGTYLLTPSVHPFVPVLLAGV